ncbi:hypothetical protein IQ272_19220 [Chroococcidiopsidales cyanobacterium LEGE 13417]|nr:hypothetical protein [Chroococcidiopsidales cyanobacterium LEGE 13417]
MENQKIEKGINDIKRESPIVYDVLIKRHEILFDILYSKPIQRDITFREQLLKSFGDLIYEFRKLFIGDNFLEIATFIFFCIGFFGVLLSHYGILNKQYIVWYVRISSAAWTFLILFNLYRYCKQTIQKNKQSNKENKFKLIHKFLERNKLRAEKDLVAINELCQIAHISTLDFVLAEIRGLIDERQAQGEVYISFVPISSLVSVVLAIAMIGNFIQAFGGTLFFGAVVGVQGFILIVNQVNHFFAKREIQRGEIFALKRSALLLEQAKSISENIED